MKCKFFDTSFSKYAGFSTGISSMLKYVVANQSSMVSTQDLIELITPIRTILKTPLANVFDQMVKSGTLDNFAAINISGKTDTSIPELLTMSNLTIDLKHTPGGQAVRTIPKLRDKVLVNISNTLSYNRNSSTYELSSVDNFMNYFVRGQLTATYHDADMWLSPSLLVYALKSYTMTLSTKIAKQFALNLAEQDRICAILAIFMGQRLSPDSSDLVHPPIYSRVNWCPTMSDRDLYELAEGVSEITYKGLTLEELCSLLSNHVSSKMNHFTREVFVGLCGHLGPEALTSQLALEFPPYWVYILLLALGGNKIPLVYQLANNKMLINEGKSKFLKGLLEDPTIYEVRG